MKTKISVVIPAYNEERYIGSCINSLVPQKPLEIIVIANSCTDKTEKIARKHAKVFPLKELGIAKARNKGLDKSSGNIIVHIDADCTASPNLLLEVKKAIKEGYAAGTCKVKPIKPSLKSNILCFFLNLFTSLFVTPHAFSFFLTDIHRKHRFDEQYSIGEDTEHFKLIKKHHKVKFIKDAYIKTSMRRFEKEGYIKTLVFEWGKAFFFPKTKRYKKVE